MVKRKRDKSKSNLRLRIISSNLAASSHTTDEVVAHLRLHFREYSRLPKNIFANNVERILTSLRQQCYGSDEFGESNSATNSGAKNFSTFTLGSVDDDDADIIEKIESECDLMKSTLRDNYVKKNKSVRKRAPELEKNKEIESKGKDGRKVENDFSIHKEDAVTSNGELSFKDLGGMNEVLEKLKMNVLFPFFNPELLEDLGLGPVDGVLLHGPPGCGKTKLAHAIANEAGVPFYEISAPELVSGVSGASEENIRDIFKQAHRTAPSIIFIDEIDAIASKREIMQREMEKRIVAQLLTCIQEKSKNNLERESFTTKHRHVLVIGATNMPDAIDPALRRCGRFGQEFLLGIPDENARFEILSILTKKCRIGGNVDLTKIARSTHGFVGADLAGLIKKASYLALNEIIYSRKIELQREKNCPWWRQPVTEEERKSAYLSMSNFEDATKTVQNSSTREGFSSIPSTKWDDIGGYESIRKEFEVSIVQRIKNPEKYKKFGMRKADGILLFGPPGCGKTTIAKAVANEAGANFIHIMGPELMNKYVGESERAIRTLFHRARTCAPCILFFDEVDALARQEHDGGRVLQGFVSQLLIELDGGDNNQGVYVIGATNSPEVMGSALLRPGRFGKKIYVGLPNAEERSLILKALARGKPIAADVDLDAIARSSHCSNLSGSDLYYSLMEEASKAALVESDNTESEMVIKKSHFEATLKRIVPTLKKAERDRYEEWAKEH